MNQNYQKIIQASLLVALSGTLYGFLGYLGTNALQESISISTMLFWRFLIAGGWMAVFVLKKHSSDRILDSLDKRVLLFTFILGAIGYAGSSGFYFMASRYTGTGLAMVIFFSYPIIVTLFSWLIQRNKIHPATFLILIAMMFGLYLLKDSGAHSFDMLGVFLAMTAAACYALYVIGSKKFSSIAIDSNLLTMTVCLGCAFIFLAIALVSHEFAVPHLSKSWISLISLGILATALPIQLMLIGLKYISSMRASIISVLEPLVTLLVGIVLLHESISHLQMLGAFIILGSALLVQFQKGL